MALAPKSLRRVAIALAEGRSKRAVLTFLPALGYPTRLLFFQGVLFPSAIYLRKMCEVGPTHPTAWVGD